MKVQTSTCLIYHTTRFVTSNKYRVFYTNVNTKYIKFLFGPENVYVDI